MKSKGFTLVELLIVIALIAILSVAVLAVINPVEQANKARDTQFKNDAAEVLNALDRFYVSKQLYPWNINGVGATKVTTGYSAVFDSTDARFGIGLSDPNGNGGSPVPGFLTSSGEVKSAFAKKTPFLSTASNQDKMYLIHPTGDNPGKNYICFVPKANVNRNSNELKCVTQAMNNNGGISDLGGSCVKNTDWTTNLSPDGTIANMICVSN